MSVILALFLFGSPSARAATLVVDGDSYRTIGAALEDAEDGDTIEVVAGTWYECLVIERSVSIVGREGSGSTVLDGGGVCDIDLDVRVPGGSFSLSGFSVSAPGGQALVVEASELTLDDVTIYDSGGAGVSSGAGIAFEGSTLTATDLVVRGSQARSCAALDLPEGVSAIIVGGSFSSNEATAGAGGAICLASSPSSPSLLLVEDVSFSANQANTSGLAIEVGEAATLDTSGCTFSDNEAPSGDGVGGAVQLAAESAYTSSGDTFSRNGGTSWVGAVEGYAINAQEDGITLLVSDGVFLENDNTTHASAAIEIGGDGTTLSVSGTTFRANEYAIHSNGPPIALEACTFEDDGWRAVQAVDLTDLGSTFSNSAANSISATGELTLVGTTFTGQTEYPALTFKGTALTIEDCVVSDNTLDGTGALAIEKATLGASISGCTFARNVNDSDGGVDYGGAITWEGDTELVVQGSVFEDNGAYLGGAISSFGGALTVIDSTFTGNLAQGGGAIWTGSSYYTGWADVPALSVSGSTFEENVATANDGGAIQLEGDGSIEVMDSFFVGNQATSHGGALWLEDLDSAALSNVYLCGNEGGIRASSGGGAGFDNVSEVEILYAIIAENRSTTAGGGLWLSSVRSFALGHATVVGNDSAQGGGVFFGSVREGTVTDSIFAYTVAGDGVHTETASTADALAFTYNDWYENTDEDRGGSFSFPTTGFGNTTDDPMLADYSLDGDCWNDSFALDPDSTLIDAGSDTDADGSAGDIGATGGPETSWVDGDGDGALYGWDCDDEDGAVSPAAEELCDGVDNDCDGEVDGADASGTTTWYADEDGDGHGDDAVSTEDCDAPEGYVDVADDCDDRRADVHPGATDDSADGVDQDCDGVDGFADSAEPEETGEPGETGETGETDESGETGEVDSGGGEESDPPGGEESGPRESGDGPGDGKEEPGCGCGSASPSGLAGLLGAALLTWTRRRSGERRGG